MKLEGIIFDFNGTLFLDTPLHVAAWNEVSLRLCNKPCTHEDLVTIYGGMRNDQILRMMKPGMDDEFYQKESFEKEAEYRKNAVKIEGGPKLVDGAIELFELLKKRNIPFTIATASIKANVDFYIEAFHLEKYFDVNTIVYDDGNFHSKKEMYEEAARRLNISTNMLVFEDGISGIEAASSIEGVKLIVMDVKELHSLYPNYPSIIKSIHDYNEVIPLIDELF